MIVSLERRAVFIHVPKTGGTSVSAALREMWPDAADQSKWTGGFSRTWHVHMTPVVAKHLIREWDDLFKFAFVRNPWDRMISLWMSTGAHREFIDFVRNPYPSKAPYFGPYVSQQVDYTQGLDKVGRFERLEQDFCGMPPCGMTRLKHLNSSGEHKPYREYYTSVTRDLVADMYARDIKAFGYEF